MGVVLGLSMMRRVGPMRGEGDTPRPYTPHGS